MVATDTVPSCQFCATVKSYHAYSYRVVYLHLLMTNMKKKHRKQQIKNNLP